MATFLISSVSSNITSKPKQVLNKFYNSPIGSLLGEKEEWKADKLSPRLSDLTIQKSAYNEIIPIVYGRNRIAGNIIWATDIIEKESTITTSSGGGKGSKAVYRNESYYSYFANIAIAIATGEVNELSKVWADTQLLDLSQYTYRFYNGSEYQLPDPLIEAKEGVGNTPAYRGLSYIVFEEFPITPFGNRIPNFTFEITRIVDSSAFIDKFENVVSGVNVIPATGEFAYDTILQYKIEGIYSDGFWYPTGKKTRINQNNNENKTDAMVSLDQLQKSLPGCNWVAPVVAWFGSSTDIADCTITPKVEQKYNSDGSLIQTEPDVWKVSKWTRSNAEIVGKDNGAIRYGGTIADCAVLRYVQELKSRNLNVMFYPMIFIDAPQKPWRGYLTGNVNNIQTFFRKANGYNEFILHYAELVKDYVDVFVIGSELRDLTSINSDDTFPAVDEFIDLARQVKAIVGNNVKVTYAADWSEYHHTNGGWFHLDKLWASEYIDIVGIDAYFPLTDKKQELITRQDIIEGWKSGEGYDWYYEDENRTKKVPMEPKYAWKNIEWWWNNQHENPDGNLSDWVPKSKKIWFTEYGFASVDGCTNEPNKFYSASSMDGGFPRFSDGKIDNFAQKQALEATEEAWKNSEIIENKFVWCWDARPYPYFPNNTDLWSDGSDWAYGHWLNGKMSNLNSSELIYQLFSDFNVNKEIIGRVSIYDNVEGLVINNKMSLLEVLRLLRKVYFFDSIESDGKINFVSKSSKNILTIEEDELLPIENNEYLKIDFSDTNELPKKLDLSYISKDFNYQAGNMYAENMTCNSDKTDFESIPMVLSEYKARQVAEVNLYSAWTEKLIYSFILPIKYLYLENGDVITLKHNNSNLKLRIQEINLKDNNTIEIQAVRCDNSVYRNFIGQETDTGGEVEDPIGKTQLKILELPALNNDSIEKAIVYFAFTPEEKGWKGVILYNSIAGNYTPIDETKTQSIIGKCLNVLGGAKAHIFDYKNKLKIFFDLDISEKITTVTKEELYLGLNYALIGNEIIQFEIIELQEDGNYIIKNLLRGLFGTEKYIETHIEGEDFIFINKGLRSKTFDDGKIGITTQYKAVSIGTDFYSADTVNYTITGKNLKPLPPVHLKIDKINKKITWKRRERGYAGWRDGVDLPIIDKVEKYRIKIYQNDTILVNEEIISSLEYIYSDDISGEIKVSVCQIGDIIGDGDYCEKSFTI